jgi:hypothetical protein
MNQLCGYEGVYAATLFLVGDLQQRGQHTGKGIKTHPPGGNIASSGGGGACKGRLPATLPVEYLMMGLIGNGLQDRSCFPGRPLPLLDCSVPRVCRSLSASLRTGD